MVFQQSVYCGLFCLWLKVCKSWAKSDVLPEMVIMQTDPGCYKCWESHIVCITLISSLVYFLLLLLLFFFFFIQFGINIYLSYQWLPNFFLPFHTFHFKKGTDYRHYLIRQELVISIYDHLLKTAYYIKEEDGHQGKSLWSLPLTWQD